RERYQDRGKILQVAALLAPDIRSVDFVIFVNRETDGALPFPVARTAVVGQAKKRCLAGGGGERMGDENVGRMTVEVAKPQQHLLAQLAFAAQIPCEVARRSAGPLRERRSGERINAADIGVAVAHRQTDGQARGVKL